MSEPSGVGAVPANLPTITDAILDQWEASARVDAATEKSWSAHPLAILAVIRDLRDVRGRLAAVTELAERFAAGYAMHYASDIQFMRGKQQAGKQILGLLGVPGEQ